MPSETTVPGSCITPNEPLSHCVTCASFQAVYSVISSTSVTSADFALFQTITGTAAPALPALALLLPPAALGLPPSETMLAPPPPAEARAPPAPFGVEPPPPPVESGREGVPSAEVESALLQPARTNKPSVDKKNEHNSRIRYAVTLAPDTEPGHPESPYQRVHCVVNRGTVSYLGPARWRGGQLMKLPPHFREGTRAERTG